MSRAGVCLPTSPPRLPLPDVSSSGLVFQSVISARQEHLYRFSAPLLTNREEKDAPVETNRVGFSDTLWCARGVSAWLNGFCLSSVCSPV